MGNHYALDVSETRNVITTFLSADFMKDVSKPKPRPKPAAGGGLGSLMSSTAAGGSAGTAQKTTPTLTAASRPAPAQPQKVTVTKVFDFAGETVTYVAHRWRLCS